MKKALTLLLMAATAAALTGCGKQDTPVDAGSEAVTAAEKEETVGEADQESSAKERKEVIKVTVGDFLKETFLYPVKIANKLGYFEEEFGKDNIEINVEYLGGGAVMVEALTAGDLDMSFLGGQPTFSGIANGNQTKVISMATVSVNNPVLLVAADSDITDVAQLKGKEYGGGNRNG